MLCLRVVVLSSFLLLTSASFLADSALAQRAGAGYRVRAGPVARPFGPRAGAFHRFRGHHRFGHRPFGHRRFDHFGFFGFPHRRFDLFFGFPDKRFFLGLRHRRFPFGFPRRHFGFFDGFGFPIGVPFWAWPAIDPVVVGEGAPPATRGPDLGVRAADVTADTPTGEIGPAADPRVAVAGSEGVGDSLVVERVSVVDAVTRGGLRLTWERPEAGQEPEAVTLFLADRARDVLAAQTVRAPPYAALFEPPAGTTFVGMTVAWPDGSTATRVVAYRGEFR